MRCINEIINVVTSGHINYKAELIGYVQDDYRASNINQIRPAVLILPGGGYTHTSRREGEAAALRFVSQGICAFVLRYSTYENGEQAHFPQALCEALESIRYIREHAEEFYIDKDRIAVCGFSAGGHLAGSTAVFWNNAFLDEYIGKDRQQVKPNLLILSYPVISSGQYAHQGSFKALLGENPPKELLELNSLEKQVTEAVPPCFIWHNYEDQSVSVQNTLLFASALIEKGIKVELHIYPRDGHGTALGNFLTCEDLKRGESKLCAEWIEKAIRFIYNE